MLTTLLYAGWVPTALQGNSQVRRQVKVETRASELKTPEAERERAHEKHEGGKHSCNKQMNEIKGVIRIQIRVSGSVDTYAAGSGRKRGSWKYSTGRVSRRGTEEKREAAPQSHRIRILTGRSLK